MTLYISRDPSTTTCPVGHGLLEITTGGWGYHLKNVPWRFPTWEEATALCDNLDREVVAEHLIGLDWEWTTLPGWTPLSWQLAMQTIRSAADYACNLQPERGRPAAADRIWLYGLPMVMGTLDGLTPDQGNAIASRVLGRHISSGLIQLCFSGYDREKYNWSTEYAWLRDNKLPLAQQLYPGVRPLIYIHPRRLTASGAWGEFLPYRNFDNYLSAMSELGDLVFWWSNDTPATMGRLRLLQAMDVAGVLDEEKAKAIMEVPR